MLVQGHNHESEAPDEGQEVGHHHQHPGPENQDGQHMLDQPRPSSLEARDREGLGDSLEDALGIQGPKGPRDSCKGRAGSQFSGPLRSVNVMRGQAKRSCES